MIKKISFAALAVALVVATTPHAWAEGNISVTEASEASPAAQAEVDKVTATPGWNLFGTCEWRIVDSRNPSLTIRPAGNGEKGSMPPHSSREEWPWKANSRYITKVTIEGTVELSENASAMFQEMVALTSIDLSGLDTSKATNMSAMFSGCEKLTSLDLSAFDTSNVTNTGFMFSECRSLISLNLGDFNTSEVTTSWFMFNNCYLLKSLDLSNFKTSSTANTSEMFTNCRSLGCINLSKDIAFQKELPNKTWYNATGESFTPGTIPVGVAGTYATSMEWFEDLDVSLSESEKAVSAEDEPFTLVATVTPAVKAENPVWSSSDSDVASVDSTGTVTVHKAGTATITAAVKDAHDSCLVTVNPLVIGTTGDSNAEGQLTVEDAETAKALKGYSLLIRPSVHKESADFERRLLADVAQQQGKAGAIADLLDVCLVDTATGAEMDPSVAEGLPPLDLSISLDNNLKGLTAKNSLGLWAVSDSGDAAKAASLEGDHFQTLATVPGTYAIIATAKADSTGGNGSSSGDGSGSTSGNGSSSGDNGGSASGSGSSSDDGNNSTPGNGNEPSGSDNDDGSSKPGNDDDNQSSGDPSNKPDSENKPSTDGSATGDNNNDSNDNSSNESNSSNSNNTANQDSTAGADSSSNSSMNSVSESKADKEAENTDPSSTKDSKNSLGSNKLSQTSDYTALKIALIFILSISAAGAAVFSARKFRSPRRLR